jgi:hypothetical protein
MNNPLSPNGGAVPQQPAIPLLIMPAPGPEQVQTGVVGLSDGTRAVQIIWHTTTGVGIYFLPPDVADTVAANIKKSAAEARTGLTIAGGGPPDSAADAVRSLLNKYRPEGGR